MALGILPPAALRQCLSRSADGPAGRGLGTGALAVDGRDPWPAGGRTGGGRARRQDVVQHGGRAWPVAAIDRAFGPAHGLRLEPGRGPRSDQ